MFDETADVDFEKIWAALVPEFALSDHRLHGPPHWRRVESNALEIAEHSGADKTVVRLFAVFHDVKRETNGYDPEHGYRAAEFALERHGELFTIPEVSLQLLLVACRLHNDGQTSDCATIGTCWDADRLDLPRVGMRPEVKYMSTEYGKQKVRDQF